MLKKINDLSPWWKTLIFVLSAFVVCFVILWFFPEVVGPMAVAVCAGIGLWAFIDTVFGNGDNDGY